MSAGRLARRAFAALLVVAALAFLARTVARDWGRLEAYEWHIQPLLLVASVVALVGVFAFGVFVWSRAIACMEGPRVPFPALLRIWFLSNLARYIPGKVWQFLGAAQLARDEGLEPVLLLTSLVVNMGFTLLSALLVGLATLPSADVLARVGGEAGAPWAPLLGVAAVLLAIVGVHPAVINGLLRLVPRWLHQTVLVWRGSWWDGVLQLLLGVLSWLLYGAALLLFVHALLRPPTTSLLLVLTGANALAFLTGYLVIIVPAGLGARELSMAALLGRALPGGVAAVVALASRLWIVAAELVGAAAVLAFLRRERTKTG